MAIQFPNTAQNIIAGQSAGAGLMSAYSNAAANLGRSIEGIGESIGSGLGAIITRQREKKAAQMLEDATEEKRRYLAGDFKDDEDKAALEARYSIPESEQFTALAARIRPWSSALSEGLLDRAKQAKAAETEILKMGGDPQLIKFQNQVDKLVSEKNKLLEFKAKAASEPYLLASGAVETADEDIARINRSLDLWRSRMEKHLGIQPEAKATEAAPAPEGGEAGQGEELPPPNMELAKQAGFTGEERERYLKYYNELGRIFDFDELAKRITEITREEPSERINTALVGILAARRKQALTEENTFSEMEKRKLDMAHSVSKEARDYWGSLEGASYGSQNALDSLSMELGEMTEPTDLGEAQQNLKALSYALQEIARTNGDAGSEQVKSLGNAALSLLNLAGREEITAEEYNAAVRNAIAKAKAVAVGVNRRIDKRLAGTDGEKRTWGETLRVEIPEIKWARLTKTLSKNWGNDEPEEKKPAPPRLPPPPPGITEEKLDAAAGGIK